MSKISIRLEAATAIGGQKINQDVFLADGFISSSRVNEQQEYAKECDTTQMLHVFAVCDGVGMFKSSGSAAEAALRRIKEKQDEANQAKTAFTADQLNQWVKNAIVSAKQAMAEYCEKEYVSGSATIVLLAIANDIYSVANVGDSPAFLVTEEQISELSVPHNMAYFKKMIGLTPFPGEECILMHHLGDTDLTIEQKSDKITENCTFIVCSDGISNTFSEDEIFKTLMNQNEAAYLVSSASKIPESDNCTAITVRIKCTDI